MKHCIVINDLIKKTAERDVAEILVLFDFFRRTLLLFYVFSTKGLKQGVPKRCLLSYLTNSALVYEPKCGEM
jgi:hypothetical protein